MRRLRPIYEPSGEWNACIIIFMRICLYVSTWVCQEVGLFRCVPSSRPVSPCLSEIFVASKGLTRCRVHRDAWTGFIRRLWIFSFLFWPFSTISTSLTSSICLTFTDFSKFSEISSNQFKSFTHSPKFRDISSSSRNSIRIFSREVTLCGNLNNFLVTLCIDALPISREALSVRVYDRTILKQGTISFHARSSRLPLGVPGLIVTRPTKTFILAYRGRRSGRNYPRLSVFPSDTSSPKVHVYFQPHEPGMPRRGLGPEG